MAAPRKENIKDIVLNATTALLENHSFAEISLAEIAKAAEISKGTLYYHYKTKSEIFFDLADRYLCTQWDDFIRWTENKEKDTSIQRLVKYVIERNTVFAGLRLHLFCEAQIGDEALREKLVKRYDDFQKLISEKIAERTDLPADFLTWLILLASDGIVVQEVLRNEKFDKDAFITESSGYLKQFNRSFANDNTKDANA